MLLRPGNAKLGKGLFSWSVPADTTCPGKSEVCAAICYAKHGHYVFENVKTRLEINLEIARQNRFANLMTLEIARRKARRVRVHAAGDFYSVAYTRAWLQIVQACPDTEFWAYTRSWMVKRLRPLLLQLARQPNFTLWLSGDRSMPRPPRWKHTYVCYVALDDDDKPSYKADLVFRHRPKTVVKSMNGAIVCPVENGVQLKHNDMTCAQCRLCFDPQRLAVLRRRRAIAFADQELTLETAGV